MEKMTITATRENGYTHYNVCNLYSGTDNHIYAYVTKSYSDYVLIINGNKIAYSRTLKAMKEGIANYTPYEICGKYFISNMMPINF